MLGRETEPDISCEWNPKISIISESASKRVHSKRIPKFSKTFPGIFTVPFNKIADRRSRNFWSNGKRPWYGNFRRKIPENPEIVEFPRSEPFNRKLWKFGDENQMERLFPGKYFRKFEYTHEVGLFFGNSVNLRFAIQRCFCRDRSELDTSRKDAYP